MISTVSFELLSGGGLFIHCIIVNLLALLLGSELAGHHVEVQVEYGRHYCDTGDHGVEELSASGQTIWEEHIRPGVDEHKRKDARC